MVEKPNDVPTLKLPIVTTKVPKIYKSWKFNLLVSTKKIFCYTKLESRKHVSRD